MPKIRLIAQLLVPKLLPSLYSAAELSLRVTKWNKAPILRHPKSYLLHAILGFGPILLTLAPSSRCIKGELSLITYTQV